MGWDIAIWGTLKMDPSMQAAWRKTVMNGRSWKDWKAWFKNASPGEPREVATVSYTHLDVYKRQELYFRSTWFIRNRDLARSTS